MYVTICINNYLYLCRINNANEVPYCAIQLSKLMKLIKEKDELQAQVSSLKATLEAKDDVIQQIKLYVITLS